MEPDKPKAFRCAIYTRKSTEEGLDQEYRPPVPQQPSFRLSENCAQSPFPGTNTSPSAPPESNYTSPPLVIGGLFLACRSLLAQGPEDRKRFNPHSVRSGSVQRILSAMLREGLIHARALVAGALRIES